MATSSPPSDPHTWAATTCPCGLAAFPLLHRGLGWPGILPAWAHRHPPLAVGGRSIASAQSERVSLLLQPENASFLAWQTQPRAGRGELSVGQDACTSMFSFLEEWPNRRGAAEATSPPLAPLSILISISISQGQLRAGLMLLQGRRRGRTCGLGLPGPPSSLSLLASCLTE